MRVFFPLPVVSPPAARIPSPINISNIRCSLCLFYHLSIDLCSIDPYTVLIFVSVLRSGCIFVSALGSGCIFLFLRSCCIFVSLLGSVCLFFGLAVFLYLLFDLAVFLCLLFCLVVFLYLLYGPAEFFICSSV